MRIYWKALLGYGFVFWTLLCVTDFLEITNVHNYREKVDWLYDEQPVIDKGLQDYSEQQTNNYDFESFNFGWAFLLWNTIVFISSVLICYFGRYVAFIFWERYHNIRNKTTLTQLPKPDLRLQRSLTSLSKIPVMVKMPIHVRCSETNVKVVETNIINHEKSCPNLLSRRSGSSLSSPLNMTKTLYTNDLFNNDSIPIENLQQRCKKYREELLKLQTTSLKEHAILSRKLEAVTKEKKELTKQLTLAQKENRAAKQQLEELIQEKATLVKKLENATKEFRSNTKTKKAALSKLEEVTENVERLRLQLEQVSRDKEILEKKLGLLENEYNKLHERYVNSQRSIFSTVDENVPERDRNELGDENSCQSIQKPVHTLVSVSQTELDMKNIQLKIKQLEKNLENFNMTSNEFLNRNVTQGESELSLSTMENSESHLKLDEEDMFSYAESGYSGNNSPRQKYWSERVAELMGSNKNKFAKIQALAIQMREKAKLLGHVAARSECHLDDCATDGFSSTEERQPRRIVSSSLAFKNFLRRSVQNPIIF